MISFPPEWKSIKAVLSHDWLTGMRGGERVLELLCEGFPDAPVYSLLHNPGTVSKTISRHRIETSCLQKVPGIFLKYRWFLPFFPWAVGRMKTPGADVLISTSHCIAKGVKPAPGTRHLCYCFTPMRYAWIFYDEYFGKNPFKKALFKPVLNGLRQWDMKASERVDRFVAISEHVRSRIQACYGRDADVVYPPVNTDFYTPAGEPEDFDLIVSALVPYKRIDLAVMAYNQTGKKLKIVGIGTDGAELRRAAGPNIEFLGWQDDAAVRDLYRRCRCLVFPGEEDFGIVPLEAQACGRPVVAYARGGALETVVDGVSGVFFKNQTADDLISALEKCHQTTWNSSAIRAHAEKFSRQHFIDGFAESIRTTLAT